MFSQGINDRIKMDFFFKQRTKMDRTKEANKNNTKYKHNKLLLHLMVNASKNNNNVSFMDHYFHFKINFQLKSKIG